VEFGATFVDPKAAYLFVLARAASGGNSSPSLADGTEPAAKRVCRSTSERSTLPADSTVLHDDLRVKEEELQTKDAELQQLREHQRQVSERLLAFEQEKLALSAQLAQAEMDRMQRVAHKKQEKKEKGKRKKEKRKKRGKMGGRGEVAWKNMRRRRGTKSPLDLFMWENGKAWTMLEKSFFFFFLWEIPA
jgi:hypothetical protein